jgi:hypothetical protein
MPRALYFPREENAVPYARLAASLVVLVSAAPAAGIPAVVGARNAHLTEPAPPPLAIVDNGDFARGLEGWQSAGREPPEIVAVNGGRAAVLRLNTTLASPPFTVPAGAQAVSVTARAAAGGALLEITARAEDGGPGVALGTIAPGPTRRAYRLPVAGIAGRTVRLVLDPVAGLGRSVEIGGVGPIEIVVPSWQVRAGVPEPVVSGGRRALRVSEGALELVSMPFAGGPAARALLVAVRGDGSVSAKAGAGARRTGAGSAWRDIRVPLPRAAGAVTLAIRAAAGDGPVEISDLGLVVRATSRSGIRVVRQGARVTVHGRIVPAGGGLWVELRLPSGSLSGVTRSARDGRFSIGGRAPVRSAVLVVRGDRTRIGGRWPLRLPAPPRPR